MIAIWGANGFIGRHLTNTLASGGGKLKLFSRDYNGFPLAEAVGISRLKYDFSSPGDYIHELENCRAAVLMVTSSFVRDSKRGPEDEVEQNVVPYRKFFEALQTLQKPPEHIVYVSSGAVYGVTDPHPISENHMLRPVSAYGQSKMAIERLISDIQNPPWSYSILRVANPVGVWSKRQASLIDRSLKAIKTGEPLTVFGDGSAVRDYFDVRELAQAIRLAIENPGAKNKIFNVGSGKGFNINEAIEITGQATGQKVPTITVAENAADAPYNVLDCSAIKETLGWQAKTALKDIVKTMWDGE